MPGEVQESVRQALATLDAYMAAFNAQDMEALARTLNYPHVRFASGTVRIWATPREFAEGYLGDLATRLEAGWQRSGFDAREIIHASDDKVHVAVQFTRFGPNDARLATYRSLWIVTRVGGHWGIQARSSFAR